MIYLKLLFYKPILGSSGAMQSFICYLRSNCCSDGLQYLILHFPTRPLLGLVGKTASTPTRSPDVSIMVGIYPLVFFLGRCIVQHLALSEKSWGMLSILRGSISTFCVRHFCRRLQSCWWIWCQFTHELALYRPILSSFSALIDWLLK